MPTEDKSATLTFHPELAVRCNEYSMEVLGSIRSLTARKSGLQPPPDFYPIGTITPEDVVAPPELIYEADALGDVKGVLWRSGDLTVGWTGEGFEFIRKLNSQLLKSAELRKYVAADTVLKRTCEWLKARLERSRDDSLTDFIASTCTQLMKTHEIWIPLFRTYSQREFRIGEVTFRTISRGLMDEWWSRIPTDAIANPLTCQAFTERRSRLQGSLAACVTVYAEEKKAIEMARVAASNAVALLRLLSPANCNSRAVCYCAISGSEVKQGGIDIIMSNGKIGPILEGVHDARDPDWFLDDSIKLRPGILEGLDHLARNRDTELRKSLYDALILYSRQSHASDLSDKLIFTVSALESMLLRDGNEPIQKNLGERMAFLIGGSVSEKKEIIKNLEEVYKFRSAFVHHGQQPRHVEALDRFLANAWTTLLRLLGVAQGDRHKTKASLIGHLEDLKLS